MKYTGNHKLKKPENNDNYDIENENYNMDIIDKGISPFFVATLDSTNVYKITTGNEITKLNDGFSVRVAIPSASIGSTSLIVDEVSAMPIKKVNGNSVTNLKANGVYSLTYYNGNFILASGGVDSEKVTASEPDVLTGKTYIGSNEEVHIGNMPNNGALNTSIGINGTFNIPYGFTTGGKVTQSIPLLTPSYTDHYHSGSISVGAYSGDGQIRTYFSIPNNRYINGVNWIDYPTPDLKSENIVNGKNILGVTGTGTTFLIKELSVPTNDARPVISVYYRESCTISMFHGGTDYLKYQSCIYCSGDSYKDVQSYIGYRIIILKYSNGIREVQFRSNKYNISPAQFLVSSDLPSYQVQSTNSNGTLNDYFGRSGYTVIQANNIEKYYG